VEKADRDAGVTPQETADLAQEILARTADLAERPYALIAGLKSAAAAVENAISSNAMRAAVATAVTSIINRR
jgi:hypothetical protein